MKISVSIGTAAVLGLARATLDAAPTTAYLMLGGRCLMNCAFCTQARDSQAGALALSRVTWPEYDLDDVIQHLAGSTARDTIRRVCLQVTVTRQAFEQSLAILRRIRAGSALPVDIAILPRDLEQVTCLLEAGADHIGFGLDAACERVFRQVKGGDWARHLALVEATARSFPGRSALHLIVGLGETEREMVERIQWAHDRGVTVGLFAFTPVRGTHLFSYPPPPLAVYRRLQMARWLIVHDLGRTEAMSFDDRDALTGLGRPVPAGGQAFQTSGCPDCNRPFYNEPPGGPLFNYPRRLTAAEAERALAEMEIDVHV